jgi:hypothetical protein
MPRPGRFTLGNGPGTHCIGGWVGLDRCGKSHPHRDSIHGPCRPYGVAIPTELPRSTTPVEYTLKIQRKNFKFRESTYGVHRAFTPLLTLTFIIYHIGYHLAMHSGNLNISRNTRLWNEHNKTALEVSPWVESRHCKRGWPHAMKGNLSLRSLWCKLQLFASEVNLLFDNQ